VCFYRVLKVAAGFDISHGKYFHETTPAKRQIYIKSIVKCLATAVSKRKGDNRAKIINLFIKNVLNDVKAVILESKYLNSY